MSRLITKRRLPTWSQAALCATLLVVAMEVPAAAPAPARAPSPLPLDAVVAEHDIDIFVGIQPSPDGRWIAFDDSDARESLPLEYTNQSFTHTGYSMWSTGSVYRKRLIEVASGRIETLPSATCMSWGGAWSPDGSQYAFYSDRSGSATLWIWNRATGDTRQLNSDVIRTFRNNDTPLWTPDGKNIVYRVVPENMTLADFERLNPSFALETHQTSAADVRFHLYTSNEAHPDSPAPAADPAMPWLWDARFLDDLVIADTMTGVTRRLAKRVHPLAMALSPDGSKLAFLDVDHQIPNTQHEIETLKIVALTGGPIKVLATDIVPADPASFTWSPNSDRIAYPSHEGVALADRVCYVVDISDGRKLKISAAVPHSIGSLRWGAPLWSKAGDVLYLLDTPEPTSKSSDSHLWAIKSDGSSAREVGQIEGRRIEDVVRASSLNTYWSPDDGATLIARTHAMQSKQDGFFAIDLKSGRARPLLESDVRIFRPITATSSDRHHVTFFQESARHPVEAYELDTGTRKTRQLSNLHPLIDPGTMGTVRLVDWISDAGEHLQGSLLLPPHAAPGTPLPLVVWVYGGSMGSDARNRYGFGWGPTFNMQTLATRGYAVLYPDIPMHSGTPVQDLAGAVLPAVNKLIELRIADPERLAVMGQSFGGYNTLSLITHTTRFKAAVITGSGPAELFEGYSRFTAGIAVNTGYYEQGQGSMGGTPWEQPTRYFENSPFFYLDRVTTPLLIARGTDDSISSGSGAVFTSLQRLHKPVQLIEYEHEDHVVQNPTNVIDLWERRIEWLARYLESHQ